MSLKPPYLALIEHIVKEHAAGKLKLDLATEIEAALFGCGFRIIAARELERLQIVASEVSRTGRKYRRAA
jgi:hypothetical protein